MFKNVHTMGMAIFHTLLRYISIWIHVGWSWKEVNESSRFPNFLWQFWLFSHPFGFSYILFNTISHLQAENKSCCTTYENSVNFNYKVYLGQCVNFTPILGRWSRPLSHSSLNARLLTCCSRPRAYSSVTPLLNTMGNIWNQITKVHLNWLFEDHLKFCQVIQSQIIL